MTRTTLSSNYNSASKAMKESLNSSSFVHQTEQEKSLKSSFTQPAKSGKLEKKVFKKGLAPIQGYAR